MVNALILQTQWCKLRNTGCACSSVFWQCETLWSTAPDTASRLLRHNQSRSEEAAAAVVSDSQVLVGVVLALAVAGWVQEGQLLPTALQLHHLAAQVQAALETHGQIIHEWLLTQKILNQHGRHAFIFSGIHLLHQVTKVKLVFDHRPPGGWLKYMVLGVLSSSDHPDILYVHSDLMLPKWKSANQSVSDYLSVWIVLISVFIQSLCIVNVSACPKICITYGHSNILVI